MTDDADDANDATKPLRPWDAGPAEIPNGDLTHEIARVSAAAFAMAQVATERKDFAAHEGAARALSARLAELRPRIDELPSDAYRALDVAWLNAKLDLEYVLAAGDPPLFSGRMHLFLHNGEPPA